MKGIHKANIYPFRLAILAFFAAVATFFSCGRHDSVKEEMLEYTENFFGTHRSCAEVDSMRLSLISDAKTNIDSDSLFYGRMKPLCRSLFENGEQVDAIKYLNGLIDICAGAPSRDSGVSFRAYCCLLLGAAYDEVGLSALSHEQYYRGLALIDGTPGKNHDKLRGDFYNNLGVSFFRSGDFDRAKTLLDSAMNCAAQSNNSYLTSIIHTNLSGIYSEEKDNEKSIDHLLKAIQAIPVQTDDPSAFNFGEYYSLQSELGSLYMKNGDLPMAYAYLSNAYKNISRTRNVNYLYMVAFRLASYFNMTQQPDSAKKYMAAAWRAVEESENPYYRMSLLEDEMRLEAENENFTRAFRLSTQVSGLKDSLRNRENLLRMQTAHNSYISETQEMGHVSRGLGRGWMVTFWIMALFAAVCAVSLWGAHLRRLKDGRAYSLRLKDAEENLKSVSERAEAVTHKISEMSEDYEKAQQTIRDYDRKLAEANEVNAKAGETIGDYSRRLSEANEVNEKAQEAIRDYSQKLSSFTMERLMADGRLEEIEVEAKRTLNMLASREKDAREAIGSIIAKLSVMKTGTQWDDFQQYFENVHPDFYARLDAAHPCLTAKDRRLCALISLGLTTKDIASITCLETRSVESSRNRLRKKLGLDNDSNLFEYIKSV